MSIDTRKHLPCWSTYSHIVNVMWLMENLPALSAEELDGELTRVLESSENVRHTMTLDEIVFWAGIATGLNLSRSVETGELEPHIRERIAKYAALFAECTKSAVVEMTIRDLEE
ncbi:MAG TPA: hypothetical protein VFJ47_12865 [Terriglobales bacterium]|nr:hypothetical protein [Terriglobales bacterium]